MLQVRKEGLLEDTETSPTMRETHRPLSWFVSGVLRWGSNGGGRGGWDGGKWPGFGQNEWHNNTNHITQTDRSRWVHWGWIQHLKKKSWYKNVCDMQIQWISAITSSSNEFYQEDCLKAEFCYNQTRQKQILLY